MRTILALLAIVGFSTPLLAGHDLGLPPGQAAANGADRNGDGIKNGKDYAPGQSAAEAVATDVNGDGKITAQDYAPGQIED
jgi:hypothetical protein